MYIRTNIPAYIHKYIYTYIHTRADLGFLQGGGGGGPPCYGERGSASLYMVVLGLL